MFGVERHYDGADSVLGDIADLAPVDISADILTFLLLHIETSGHCDWLAFLSLSIHANLRETKQC